MTDNPYLGDIRLCNPERDAEKPWHEITDFEIWDGKNWIHARNADKVVYTVNKVEQK